MVNAGRIAEALTVAAQARLTLAGKLSGAGFWIMPHGRSFIMDCWRQNIERARMLRRAPLDGRQHLEMP